VREKPEDETLFSGDIDWSQISDVIPMNPRDPSSLREIRGT